MICLCVSEPEWRKAAGQLGGIAKLVAVDATIHQSLAQRYGVKGYPTIKVFKPGKKGSPEDYNGGRQASDIVTYAKNVAEANAKPKPVVEITSTAVFEEHCKDKASLCLVTFVPNILDGSVEKSRECEQVEGHCSILVNLSSHARSHRIIFLLFLFQWCQGS